MRINSIIAAVALAVLACGGDEGDAIDADASGLIDEGSPEAVALLAFVDGPAATRDVLDFDVGLDRRAADGIARHVRGPDGVLGSADDDPFESLAELDAVPYVGPVAFDKLLAYLGAGGPVVTIEGVTFTAAQAAAVVDLANRASLAQLDDDAGLDARAARNIVAARPLAGLPELAAVPYVGKVALQRLEDYAPRWSAPAPCTGGLLHVLGGAPADFARLLELATSGDYGPYARLWSLRAPACLDVRDSAALSRLAGQIGASVHWAFDGAPVAVSAWSGGGAAFAAQVQTAHQAIEERVSEGWDPSASAESAALYTRADDLVAALIGPPAAAPASFLQLSLVTDAEECSERAVALLDVRTGVIVVIHRLPRC